MDFRKYLEQSSRKLNKEIQKILNQWLKEVGKIDKKLVPLGRTFVEACKGGKGIRGSLVMLGYEIARTHLPGARDHLPGGILRIASAYEIFHTSILAHDDIMDESPKRRGKQSLYKKVGIPYAITLGDIGFFLAVKIISESNFPAQAKNQALNLFSKTVVNTAIGQLLDIEGANQLLTAKLKTADYTISAPLQLGAILGGGSKKLSELLGRFGENLGVAYQIRDDILDSGTLEFSGQKGLKYVAYARKMIPKITKDSRIRKTLEEMAEYIIERRK